MNRFFSPSPIWLNNGIATMRIIVGALLIYHGIEIFTPAVMNTYLERGMFQGPSARFLVYMGKASELTCGILIFFGLLTRLGSLLAIGTFSYITFFLSGMDGSGMKTSTLLCSCYLAFYFYLPDREPGA